MTPGQSVGPIDVWSKGRDPRRCGQLKNRACCWPVSARLARRGQLRSVQRKVVGANKAATSFLLRRSPPPSWHIDYGYHQEKPETRGNHKNGPLGERRLFASLRSYGARRAGLGEARERPINTARWRPRVPGRPYSPGAGRPLRPRFPVAHPYHKRRPVPPRLFRKPVRAPVPGEKGRCRGAR